MQGRIDDLLDILSRNTTWTAIPAGLFDKYTNLTNVRISSNTPVTVPDGIFDKLVLLEEIKLDLKLTSIPAGLQHLPKLRTVDFRYQPIASIPAGFFDNHANLKIVSLNEGGQLTSLSAGIFNKNTKLALVYLDGNQLRQLPAGIFDNSPDVKIVTLNNNKALADGYFTKVLVSCCERLQYWGLPQLLWYWLYCRRHPPFPYQRPLYQRRPALPSTMPPYLSPGDVVSVNCWCCC